MTRQPSHSGSPRVERRLRTRSEVYAAALDERILEHLARVACVDAGSWVTCADIGVIVSASGRTVLTRIDRLEREGHVEAERGRVVLVRARRAA